MANEIINAFKELVDRLEAANATGQPLAGVSLIEGKSDDIREHKNLPYVEYSLVGTGFLEETCFTRFAVNKIDILIRCGEDKAKGYYDGAKTRGALWLYEKVQNAIDGTDLAGSGNWYQAPQFSISNFETSDLRTLYDINVTLTTKKYQRGSL
jgi:hypothetical protein